MFFALLGRCQTLTNFATQNSNNLQEEIEDKSAIPVRRVSKYAKQSYDAIWAMALSLAANNFGALEQFSYSNRKVGRRFFETMRKLKFVGLSVHI